MSVHRHWVAMYRIRSRCGFLHHSSVARAEVVWSNLKGGLENQEVSNAADERFQKPKGSCLTVAFVVALERVACFLAVLVNLTLVVLVLRQTQREFQETRQD